MSENTKNFELEIITPAGAVIKEDVLYVQAPGVTGYFGIQSNHLPMIVSLTFGKITAGNSSGEKIFAISGGYAQVAKNKMTVLAETVEKSSDIDIARAERSALRATNRLTEKLAGLDIKRAKASQKRALNRISIGSTHQGNY